MDLFPANYNRLVHLVADFLGGTFDEPDTLGLVEGCSVAPIGHRAALGGEGRSGRVFHRDGVFTARCQPGRRKSTIDTTHDMPSIRCP